MYSIKNGIVVSTPPEGGYKISLKTFFIIAFFLSWIGVIPMVGSSWLNADSPDWLRGLITTLAPLQLLMFFGTLMAAFFVVYRNYGLSGLKTLGGGLIKVQASWKAYLTILMGPALICFTAILVAQLFDPNIQLVKLDMSLVTNFGQILLIQLILNTEEIAWRGYALPQMQARFSPLRANLYLAAIWGLFHLPLFLMMGGHPGGQSVLLFVLMIFPTGLLMGYTFNVLGGSVILVHLLHQSINAWGEAFRVFPVMNGGSQLPMAIMVFGLIIVGAFVARKMHLQSQT